MLLTIYNLPINSRYADIKSLIHSKCGFKEMILDNLVQDGNNTKKVTIGLAEEEDAAILVRKINGMFIEGQQLYVETVKKKQAAPSTMNQGGVSQRPTLQQPYYQQSSYQPNYQLGYMDMQQTATQSMVTPSTAFGMYGTQNAFANYGYPQQTPYQSNQTLDHSMASFDQTAPLGFSNQGNSSSVWSDQNDWNTAGNASGGNQGSQQKSRSRWDSPSDNNSRSRRDSPDRQRGRDGRARSFGRDAPSRDHGRSTSSREYGRDAPSHDRRRDAPRAHGRDAPFRDRARDPPARESGREVTSRDGPARGSRDESYRRNDRNRTPPKRQYSSYDAPSKSTSSFPKPFGQHVTDPSMQRAGPKPGQSWNKPEPKPVPKKTWNAPGEYFPPPKRQRKGPGFGNQVDVQKSSVPVNKAAPYQPSIKNSPEWFARRSTTWRHQTASSLSKEIMKNRVLSDDIEPKSFLTELKRVLWSRLDALLGDDYETRMEDMTPLYRQQYGVHTDAEVYNEVMEDVKKNGTNLAAVSKTDNPVTEIKKDNIDEKSPHPDSAQNTVQKVPPHPQPLNIVKKVPPKPKGLNTVKNIPQNPQGLNTVKRIPSYPQGDKRMNKLNKKENAMIFQDEQILLSNLKPNMLQAVNEEVDDICAKIVQEFQDEPAPEDVPLYTTVKTNVADECNKMIKVNLAKRLLKVGPIMVRIFNSPKIINRTKLAEALMKYGVQSLRKSESKKAMYFATCKSYGVHDKLCLMKPLVIDGSTVNIKPFQLVGKTKLTKEELKKRETQFRQAAKLMAEEPIIKKQEINEQNDNGEQEYEDTENTASDMQVTLDSTKEEDTNENEESQYENDGAEPEPAIEPSQAGDGEEGNEENYNQAEEDSNVPPEEENNSKEPTENENNSNVPSEKENNIETNDTEQISEENKQDERNVDETHNVDFTADVDLCDKEENMASFTIDAEHEHDDNDVSEMNPEDLEDFKRNNYDDIELADLNDDDLEDW